VGSLSEAMMMKVVDADRGRRDAFTAHTAHTPHCPAAWGGGSGRRPPLTHWTGQSGCASDVRREPELRKIVIHVRLKMSG
jgi:hypothetical protein